MSSETGGIVVTCQKSTAGERVPQCLRIAGGQCEQRRSGGTSVIAEPVHCEFESGHSEATCHLHEHAPATHVDATHVHYPFTVRSQLAAWLSGQDVGLWLADFPRPVPDLWLTCDHFVGRVSAVGEPTRPTQPSMPSGSENE